MYNTNFKYSVNLGNYLVHESIEYAKYIESLYKEDIDYVLDLVVDSNSVLLKEFPVNLHRLICAGKIYFKEENDMMMFKLRFKDVC